MIKKIIYVLALLLVVSQTPSLLPGEAEAATGQEQIEYILISSKDIPHVNEMLRNSIKKLSPNAVETYIEYDSVEAQGYIKDLDIAFVPSVIYDKSIAASDVFFHMVKNQMVDKVSGYYVVPEAQLKLGEIMLLNRKREPSSLLIYGMAFCPHSKNATANIIDFIRQNELNVALKIKYLIRYDEFGVSSPYGPDEIREDLRQIILQRYYPDKFLEYIVLTQSKKPEDVLKEIGILAENLDSKSEEALGILKADYKESEALNIKRSPTFLWENTYLIPSMNWLKEHKPFNVKKKTNHKSIE